MPKVKLYLYFWVIVIPVIISDLNEEVGAQRPFSISEAYLNDIKRRHRPIGNHRPHSFSFITENGWRRRRTSFGDEYGFSNSIGQDSSDVQEEEGRSEKEDLIQKQQIKIDTLEKKLKDMEHSMNVVIKNIEVLQQNTQVISKGFNILSGRMNKNTMEQKSIKKQMSSFDTKLESSIKKIQKSTADSLNQIKADVMGDYVTDGSTLLGPIWSMQPSRRNTQKVPPAIKSMIETARNETKEVAEMVKALAIITQEEKIKLDNFTLNWLSHKESNVYGDDDQQTTNHLFNIDDNNGVRSNLDELKKDLEVQKKRLGQELSRIEETLLEQNMAHNLAHGNIMQKLSELKESESRHGLLQRIPQDFRDRLNIAEGNLTELFEKLHGLKIQEVTLEQATVANMLKINDIKNAHQQEILSLSNTITHLRDEIKKLMNNLSYLRVKIESLESSNSTKLEIGGTSLSEISNPDDHTKNATSTVLISQFKSMEKNVHELWKGYQNLIKQQDKSSKQIIDLKKTQNSMKEEELVRTLDIETRSKLLNHLVTSNSNKLEKLRNSMNKFLKSFSKTSSPLANPLEYFGSEDRNKDDWFTTAKFSGSAEAISSADSLECPNIQEIKTNLSRLSDLIVNISKAQENFIFKLLELDAEHKADNRSLLFELHSWTQKVEDLLVHFTKSDDRMNKIVQQFEFTDTEMGRIRKDLLRTQNKVTSVEASHNDIWSFLKKTELTIEKLHNEIVNIDTTQKLDKKNLTKHIVKLNETTAELSKMQSAVQKEDLLKLINYQGRVPLNNSEIAGIKEKLSNLESNVNNLWRTTKANEAKQDSISQGLDKLKSNHEMDAEFLKSKISECEPSPVPEIIRTTGSTQMVNDYEMDAYLPYESKTLNFTITNWKRAVKRGLRDQEIVYQAGQSIGHASQWKTSIEIQGQHLSLYNKLLKTDHDIVGLYNEFSAELLYPDGNTFAKFGPDMHYYKRGDRFGWPNIISLVGLSHHKLIRNDKLSLCLKLKIYQDAPLTFNSSDPLTSSTVAQSRDSLLEKQLIQWNIPNMKEVLGEKSNLLSKPQKSKDFVDLGIRKSFQSGKSIRAAAIMNKTTLYWRTSLLIRRINGQKYLGINMQLLNDGAKWEAINARYNITLLDNNLKVIKEFAIPLNNFKTISARHSYFILLEEVENLLKNGNGINFRIYFDLQAEPKT